MYTAPLPTALVINDDPSQLHLMVGLLEKDGLQVVRCQSAEEALAILDECETVDVIITDLHMPGIDGWDGASANYCGHLNTQPSTQCLCSSFRQHSQGLTLSK